MTNTKFRKRALLSSVAMLLVALVALGSATFAWFSQNSKATANDIGAKTQRGSNILVSEDASTWNDTITFQKNTIVASGSYYSPVTPGGAKIEYDAETTHTGDAPTVTIANPTWKTTTSDGVDKVVKGSAKTWDAANAGTHYSTTDLYVKYDAASSANKSVNIRFTNTITSGQENFLRVALVPVDSATQTLFGTAQVWGTSDDDFALDPNAFATLTTSNTGKTITTTNNKTLFSNKALVGGTEYHFTVYVWFEGTDVHCKDSNADTDFDIDFIVEAA